MAQANSTPKVKRRRDNSFALAVQINFMRGHVFASIELNPLRWQMPWAKGGTFLAGPLGLSYRKEDMVRGVPIHVLTKTIERLIELEDAAGKRSISSTNAGVRKNLQDILARKQ